MALTIKNDEAESMTRELAAITGESITAAVTIAVKQRLDLIRRQRTSRAAALLEIGRSVAPVLRARGAEVEDLYDHVGLPT